MTPATLTPEDAQSTIRNFIEASGRKDVKAMERCLTKKTVELGQYHSDGPDLERYEFRGAVPEGATLVVAVELFVKNAPEGQPPSMVMPFVMAQEDGAYKIDLPASMEKMFGGDLDKLMQQMADTMKTAMEGMGNALAEGLSAAFGESTTNHVSQAKATAKKSANKSKGSGSSKRSGSIGESSRSRKRSK